MSGRVVRRIRLPVDKRSPAAARDLVRAVVADAGLPQLLDEALLLTTEISTNGVVHARTELDVEVQADPDGLTVMVTDYRSGAPAVPMRAGIPHEAPDLAEHGRGLLLVDRIAASWGTTHHGRAKGVWFRLSVKTDDHRGAEPDGPDGQEPDGSRPDGPEPRDSGPDGMEPNGTRRTDGPPARAPAGVRAGGLGVGVLDWITGPEVTLADELGVAPLAGELLHRLCDVVGAAAARMELDQADGYGRKTLASHGTPGPRDPDQTMRVRLALTRPWRGELVIDLPATPDPYLRPLAKVVAGRLALLLENDRLHRTDLRRRSWLMFLAEASELLAQSLDVDLTLALIPQLVVPRLGRWCAVHRLDDWGEVHLAAATHADESQLPWLLETLELPGANAPKARLRELQRTSVRTPLSGALDGVALPMVARGNFIGTLSIGRHLNRRLDTDEIAVTEDIARRAALAVDNARIHAERSSIAQTLQQALLPPALPAVGGLEFAAEYVPTGAGVDVGGDFYDVLPISDDQWLLAIGDVSGKGVHAASVTGLVRDVIRVLAREGKPLPELVSTLNETLIERATGRYCTLALATVGPERHGYRQVRLHLAGHDRPILLRADGSAQLIGATGTAVGLLTTVNVPETVVPLGPGDALVFYTDGITERRRGAELFGHARLRETAARLAGLPADVVAARLRATALAFSPEEPRDDIAILAVRNGYEPPAPG